MTRRGGWGGLPEYAKDNGYVLDLKSAVQEAADSVGARVYVFKKNTDYFLAVCIPNPQELAAIDANSNSD